MDALIKALKNFDGLGFFQFIHTNVCVDQNKYKPIGYHGYISAPFFLVKHE